MWLDVLIKGPVVNWGYTSYNGVIIKQVAIFPEALPAEARVKGKVELLKCEEHVLEEEEVHKVGCPKEIPTAMNE
jgi:hypothetical protein